MPTQACDEVCWLASTALYLVDVACPVAPHVPEGDTTSALSLMRNRDLSLPEWDVLQGARDLYNSQPMMPEVVKIKASPADFWSG